MENFKNYAVSTVLFVDESQPTRVRMVVKEPSVFPSPPFNLTVYQPNTDPVAIKAEIVTVTQKIVNGFVIVRGAEGTTRKPILSGYVAEQLPTKYFYDLFATNVNLKTATDELDSTKAEKDQPLDEFGSPADTTNLNASTSAHGLLLKAVDPGAGLQNVVAIGNGETEYTNKALFDTANAVALGTAAAGTTLIAARQDHVHEMPKLDDLAAPDDNTDLDATTSLHGLAPKAVDPGAADLLNVLGLETGETTYTNKVLFDATNPEALGAAGPGTGVVASHRNHVHEMPKLDDLATPDDNTDLNATTLLHGLAPKAVAPAAANMLNVLGVENGGVEYDNKAIFDTTNAEPVGTAAPGTALVAARRDHVHALPDDVAIVAKFSCNGQTAQAQYASGGALNAYGVGGFGMDSNANMNALYTLVVNMRAALVANGIMS